MKKKIEAGGVIVSDNVAEQVYTSEEILRYISQMKPLTKASIAKYSQAPSLYEPAYNTMNEYERGVAQLFIEKGLLVYREVPIGTNGSTADFYVYNPRSKKGKLVEVTLIQQVYNPGDRQPSHKTRKRKGRQLVLLNATGMPFVVLYKENLESIRKRLNRNLF
ncbi:MAG: hypothetical protein BroJett025_06140 [Patescibacteria group bacterium]|nr:MAG: hypothetical protein BroJett025_06140 [Patescibacteria group bacterium]